MPTNRPSAIQSFGRRRGDAPSRVALGIGLIAVIAVLLFRLVPLVLAIPAYRGRDALLLKLAVEPVLVLVLVFGLYLIVRTARAVPRIIADRELPLLTIGPPGVTLFRPTGAELVSWDAIAGVRTEQFHTTNALVLDLRPADGRPRGTTARLGLSPLANPVNTIVDAIRGYPAYHGA